MLTNEIIKSMEVFKGLSTEGIKEKMLECKALSKRFPVKGVLPMELIENQLHDVYLCIELTTLSVKGIMIEDGCEDDNKALMSAKNTIMHGMKIIMSNKYNENYSLTIHSVCVAYIEANKNNDGDLIIPTYEECLKVYESKFMNQKLWNCNGGNFMTQQK